MLTHMMELGAPIAGPAEHTARTVAIVLAGSWIALLLHELGHAFAALALGVRIWGIRLGAGPIVWRGAISECRMHLALLPFLGAVQLLDEDACAIGYRDIAAGRWRFEWGPRAWRAPIISAAGGVSNLVGVLLLGAWWNWIGQPPWGRCWETCAVRHGSQLRRVSQPAARFPIGWEPPARAHQRGRAVPGRGGGNGLSRSARNSSVGTSDHVPNPGD
jgi:Predicted membrane-associated Zn-dependent proteases 1